MKLYVVRNRKGEFLNMIILKNTNKRRLPNAFEILAFNYNKIDKNFVNTSYFFTNDKREALLFKNQNLAYYF